MNIQLLREFGADLRLRDSENMGPTAAEVRMADEIARLRASERSAWNAAVTRDEQIERLREALGIAVCQNEHDMLMTGDELRLCRAALAEQKP